MVDVEDEVGMPVYLFGLFVLAVLLEILQSSERRGGGDVRQGEKFDLNVPHLIGVSLLAGESALGKIECMRDVSFLPTVCPE